MGPRPSILSSFLTRMLHVYVTPAAITSFLQSPIPSEHASAVPTSCGEWQRGMQPIRRVHQSLTVSAYIVGTALE